MIKGFCYGFGATLGIIFAIPIGAAILRVIDDVINKNSKEEENDG